MGRYFKAVHVTMLILIATLEKKDVTKMNKSRGVKPKNNLTCFTTYLATWNRI